MLVKGSRDVNCLRDTSQIDAVENKKRNGLKDQSGEGFRHLIMEAGGKTMEYKRFGDTVVLRILRGEEIHAAIQAVATKEKIQLATVQGIGACDYVKLGLYKVEHKQYFALEFTGEMELTSLLGNITTKEGQYYGHLHATLGLEDGSVVGGHLSEGRISATCEVFIRIIDGQVDRFLDETTGINLMKFDA